MDDLDFRKWLKEYGYTYEGYQDLAEEHKRKIESRFKFEHAGNRLKDLGDGLKGCGCVIMLLPILAALLFFIWNIIKA